MDTSISILELTFNVNCATADLTADVSLFKQSDRNHIDIHDFELVEESRFS